MPVYLVKLRRTIDYTGVVEATSASEAAEKFGAQVRENPTEGVDQDVITEALARVEPDRD